MRTSENEALAKNEALNDLRQSTRQGVFGQLDLVDTDYPKDSRQALAFSGPPQYNRRFRNGNKVSELSKHTSGR